MNLLAILVNTMLLIVQSGKLRCLNFKYNTSELPENTYYMPYCVTLGERDRGRRLVVQSPDNQRFTVDGEQIVPRLVTFILINRELGG